MADIKVFAITGGAGGMGIAIAKRFADKGALLLVDEHAERLDEVKKDLEAQGATVETLVCNIAKKDQVQNFADKAKSLGKLGAIIHTAGHSPATAPADEIVSVDAVGTALILDAFYELAEEGSVAIVIASMSGHLAPVDPEVDKIMDNPLAEDFIDKAMAIVKDDRNAAYTFSKRANIRLVEAQAHKWGQKGARIVSISPGLITTPMGNKQAENPKTVHMMGTMNPLGRFGEPDEIAGPVEFLCSPAASYINGTDLIIDGGITAVLRNTPRE